MSIIKNVDDKVEQIINSLPLDYSEADFIELFKNTFPDDYEKCRKVFQNEERKNKGKPHPMQHPNKHITNALKSYLRTISVVFVAVFSTVLFWNFRQCLLLSACFLTRKMPSREFFFLPIHSSLTTLVAGRRML